MKKKQWSVGTGIFRGGCMLFFLLGLTGCSKEVGQTAREKAEQSSIQENVTEGVTFIDDLGREVTVDDPQRVATLIGSFHDVWSLAGGKVVAATKDSWISFDFDLSEDVINIGNFLEPDVEQLIAAEPDFVIASANTDAHLELADVLTQVGITVAYFDVSTFEEYLHMLDICTQITGREELYQTYGVDIQKKIEEQKARVDGSAPTVLLLRASTTDVKAKGSEGSVGGEILADLGCVNIADIDESMLDDLSMEAILAANPDYIFVTNQGDTEKSLKCIEEILLSNPVWSNLTAVKENRYYILEKSLYNLKPNARWGEAYEKLADILYS